MAERKVVSIDIGKAPQSASDPWQHHQENQPTDQCASPCFDLSLIRDHIEVLRGQKVLDIEASQLGGGDRRSLSSVKQLRIRFVDHRTETLVLRQPTPGPFGLEEPEDHVRQCLLNYRSSSDTSEHPQAIDVGMIDAKGRVVSLADAGQFFLLEEFVEGRNYGDTDFTSMRAASAISSLEWQRAEGFAAFLADLHEECPKDDPIRYRRSLREMVGGGEGLMGIVDSFSPSFFAAHRDRLCRLEQTCLAAAQRLRDREGRLRITHGDFHPWNILFRGDRDFTAIDKGRCHMNDPAIDVGAMLMSYLMLAIWQGSLTDAPAAELARRFLSTYVDTSGDDEILTTLPLYTAMRAAAAASPEFYPDMPEALRVEAFELANRIAECESLDIGLAFLCKDAFPSPLSKQGFHTE